MSGVRYLWMGLTALLVTWAWNGADIQPMQLFANADNILEYGADFLPPDFTDWRLYAQIGRASCRERVCHNV